jgi:anti-sigma factor ChrR (cupin superfamily)
MRLKAAQKTADSLAAIKAAEARENKIAATELQAEVDAIQNQVLNDFHIQQVEPNEEQKINLDKIVALLPQCSGKAPNSAQHLRQCCNKISQRRNLGCLQPLAGLA